MWNIKSIIYIIFFIFQLTFCHLMSIDERLSYTAHPDDPSKTLLTQEAVVTVRGIPLSSYLEGFLTNTISLNANKGRQVNIFILKNYMLKSSINTYLFNLRLWNGLLENWMLRFMILQPLRPRIYTFWHLRRRFKHPVCQNASISFNLVQVKKGYVQWNVSIDPLIWEFDASKSEVSTIFDYTFAHFYRSIYIWEL